MSSSPAPTKSTKPAAPVLTEPAPTPESAPPVTVASGIGFNPDEVASDDVIAVLKAQIGQLTVENAVLTVRARRAEAMLGF